MKINSFYIKAALMSYYRFKRGYLCVDECACTNGEISDILVDTGKAIIDIEIKISKSDLIKGEARKTKHNNYKSSQDSKFRPNKFYLCVPEELREVAEEWVTETNPKYGIIICSSPIVRWGHDLENCLQFIKNAQNFNKLYSGEYYKERIAKRLSSARTTTFQKAIIKAEFEKRIINEKNSNS